MKQVYELGGDHDCSQMEALDDRHSRCCAVCMCAHTQTQPREDALECGRREGP